MQRAPLTPIDSNRRPGSQLSNDLKSVLYGRALAGQTTSEIARAESLDRRTVQAALRRVRICGVVTAAPRSGRLRKHNERDDRIILRTARVMPKITYAKLKSEVGLDLSRSTYNRILRKNGITNWLAKKRPLLHTTHARLRLAFARKWAHVTPQE